MIMTYVVYIDTYIYVLVYVWTAIANRHWPMHFVPIRIYRTIILLLGDNRSCQPTIAQTNLFFNVILETIIYLVLSNEWMKMIV